jgi:hypothetical protein
VSCSITSGRVAYCLGTASGSEGFDRVSALRELVEEQDPVVLQCWGMSPELGSLAWQAFYSGSRCTIRRHQDHFRFGDFGLGILTQHEYITRSLLVGLASITERLIRRCLLLNRTDPQSSSSFIRPGRQGDGEPLG